MKTENTSPETSRAGLTRSKVLKRAGVGAAALWAGPLVLTTEPVAAANPVTRCVEAARGGACACVSIATDVGPVCSGDQCCVCQILTSGCCACVDLCELGCGTTQPCNKNRDCPRGFKCMDTVGECEGPEAGRCVPVCKKPATADGPAADAASVWS